MTNSIYPEMDAEARLLQEHADEKECPFCGEHALACQSLVCARSPAKYRFVCTACGKGILVSRDPYSCAGGPFEIRMWKDY